MSKCSEKCNDIKRKIDSISGLDDHYILKLLTNLEYKVNETVSLINKYESEDELNGTCFK